MPDDPNRNHWTREAWKVFVTVMVWDGLATLGVVALVTWLAVTFGGRRCG